MGRLIAFDPQTASALVAKTRTAAQLGHGSPLKAALANEGESTLLMRAASSNDVLVVNVRRPQPAPQVVAPPVIRAEAPRKATTPAVTPVVSASQVSKPAAPPQRVESLADSSKGAVPTSAPMQQQVKPAESAVPPRSDAPIPARPTQTDSPKKAAPREDNEPVAYEATGFLGLGDSPLYEEDLEPQPKKKWWKKILE